MEGRWKLLGLDEPSGLTVGPDLIGRPASAWMTTKQDEQRWLEGRVGTPPHGMNFLPQLPSQPFLILPTIPQAIPSASVVSLHSLKNGWLRQHHHKTHPDRTGAKLCKYTVHSNASHWPSRAISNLKYTSGYRSYRSGLDRQCPCWFRF